MIRLVGFMVLTVALLLAVTPSSPAAFVYFVATMDGPSESPPVPSPGVGFSQVDFDMAAHIMRVQVIFSGLIGTTTVSHIHAPTAMPMMGTAGVATATPSFPGFPGGVTSGSYDHTFDTGMPSTYSPAFLTANGGDPLAAEGALFAALTMTKAYTNVHTTFASGGEIRGFLIPSASPVSVPEPSSFLLVGLGACGMIVVYTRRRMREKAETTKTA